MRRRLYPVALLLLFFAFVASAHVGNPDIYFDGNAGPYKLFVTVRPPVVIPGVAEVEVRSQSPDVQSISAVPVPLNAGGAKFAPVPDALKISTSDRSFFTGSLWIMAAGSWQVRMAVDGAAGKASLAVPVPSVALATKKMQTGMGLGLGVLMVLLVAGLVLITGASVREAKLDRAAEPSPAQVKRARVAMGTSLVMVVAILAFGWQWWNASEQEYRRNIFSPLGMRASIDPTGRLQLRLAPPAVQTASPAPSLRPVFFSRTVDDFIPDHDHLMHLYALREPGLDVVYHLHPEPAGAGIFNLALPEMEPGHYRLYADVVHANGFPETLVSDVDIPRGLPSRPLAGDDARGDATPWQSASLENSFALPDGYRMIWKRPAGILRAKQARAFEFQLVDKNGKAPGDMALYMGMPGHAAFVKTDGSAFAHIHPSGTVSMASLMMAQSQLANQRADAMDMASMDHSAHQNAPNDVLFPYGFPTAGRYRIIVQMKHGSTVETGIFDTAVE